MLFANVIFVVLSCVTLCCASFVRQDANGNLHVNSEEGKTVFVNGVNITALIADVSAMKVNMVGCTFEKRCSFGLFPRRRCCPERLLSLFWAALLMVRTCLNMALFSMDKCGER